MRIDREAGRPLEQVDILVGSVRGEVLFGWRPEARPASHAFHYAIVPAGEYALVYMDSSANNVVSTTSRWVCANDAAPIYTVGAGAITVVLAPDRIPYDLIRDNSTVRMAVLGQFPPGTTLEYLRSEEKTALDFAEIAATNTSLTAPYAFAAPVGTLAFEAPEGARLDRCLPGEGFSVTPAP